MRENQKYVGVWIDKKEALFIGTSDQTNKGDFDILKKIKFEHHSHHGSSEHVQNQRDSNELNQYFKSLVGDLSEYDEVYLFGPGQIQEQLKNFAPSQNFLREVNFTLGTADTHMTKNQIIAAVRDYFKTI